jgi:CheY-like chemotaxis protein
LDPDPQTPRAQEQPDSQGDGHCLPDDEARSLAAGFQAHLLKPFAPQEMIELLKKAGST